MYEINMKEIELCNQYVIGEINANVTRVFFL